MKRIIPLKHQSKHGLVLNDSIKLHLSTGILHTISYGNAANLNVQPITKCSYYEVVFSKQNLSRFILVKLV